MNSKQIKIYYKFFLLGDVRMLMAEDNNKVSNIVRSQIPNFRTLYNPILRELKDYVHIDTYTGWGRQDTSYAAKFYHLSMLPKNLQVKFNTFLSCIN